AKVREHAPDFCCDAVINGRFTQRSLNYYLSRDQWLMILFMPMAFSFVCPTEVLAFDNVLEEFTEQECSVVFVSTDSKYSLHSWQTRPKREGGLGEINVPLLSDQNHKMSKAYGVLVEDEGIALRGRFIINPLGIIKHISINDVAVGRSVLESLRLLQAYKAEYENGVFCAANWKPGDTTLAPTQEAAQEYINEHFGELSVKD
ncbi:thioredoxin-like protein, partial [Rhizodiscina lignyota]